MTQQHHLLLVQRLAQSQEPLDQKHALQSIKSAVIGHIEKKEQLVRAGILDVLKQILLSADRVRGKRGQLDSNGPPHDPSAQQSATSTQEEDVRGQAVILLGSLANAGPSFLAAIGASDIFPHLLAALSPLRNPSNTVIAALKAILAIADAELAADYCSYSDLIPSKCIPQLYTLHNVQSLAHILAQKSADRATLFQVELAARLVKITCTKDLFRNMLLDGGVLDLLSARLAAQLIRGESWTHWDQARHGASLAAELPPLGEEISHVLGALASIVHTSRYRAIRVVCSPTVNNVFSVSPPDTMESHRFLAGAAEVFELSRIPAPLRKGDERNYPPLPPSQQATTTETSHLESTLTDDTPDDGQYHDGCLSSLITWLLVVVKKYHGLRRVEAANLLSLLCLSQAVQPDQERMFSVIVVPSLIRVLDDVGSPTAADQMRVVELALNVLARLIKPDPQLQLVAFDAHAHTRVCKILKSTFQNVEPHSVHWSPDVDTKDATGLPPSCTITRMPIPPDTLYRFRVREGALYLLAATAYTEDACRTAYTEAGMTNVIRDCMQPLSKYTLARMEQLVRASRKDKLALKDIGNPDPVLVAACNAGRVLARSVRLLRTSLIDVATAGPTAKLLSHPNVEVVIAATDFACNLSPEFSPTREDLMGNGAIEVLCENAKTANAELCYRSLWCLKHLIYQSLHEHKIMIMDMLETGRLVHLIRSDPSARANKRYTEAVQSGDILDGTGQHRPGQNDGDVTNGSNEGLIIAGSDRCAFSDHGDVIALDLLGYQGPTISSDALRAKVLEVFNQDRHQIFRSYLDTAVSVQRQSLDIIRNFIMGPRATDTIDYIFQHIQKPDIFVIVAAAICSQRPLGGTGTTPAFDSYMLEHDGDFVLPSNRNGEVSDRVGFTHSPDLLQSAVMILTHIAAGSPAQRQKLLSCRPLMKLVHSLLSHPEARVRVAVVFCIANLTWIDDEADRRAAENRAIELRQLGFVDGLEARKDDDSIDVKERVMTARTQLYDLLGMDPGERRTGVRDPTSGRVRV